MDNLSSWKVFEATGKVEDYLKYADERRMNEARENFISAINNTEGKEDGRDSYGSGDGNIFHGYK